MDVRDRLNHVKQLAERLRASYLELRADATVVLDEQWDMGGRLDDLLTEVEVLQGDLEDFATASEHLADQFEIVAGVVTSYLERQDPIAAGDTGCTCKTCRQYRGLARTNADLAAMGLAAAKLRTQST